MLVQAALRNGTFPNRNAAREQHDRESHDQERLSFGSLAEAASKLPVPQTASLKDPTQFKLIGKPQKRMDTPAKVSGRPCSASM